MLDKNNRRIDYLRISITDRCNLRCQYCMPEEGVESIGHQEILSYDEIVRVARIGAELGITKIKVTGGEPLVRKHCAVLVKLLKEIPGIEKVTITTNGVLLAEQMPALYEAGIDGINISLDTLGREAFAAITRKDALGEVLEGLDAALSYPGINIKINCVPILEDPENLVRMAELAKKYPVHVRFIEMMPIGLGKQFAFRGEDDILRVLTEAFGEFRPFGGSLGNGPCHYYEAEGFLGKIGFISAMTHKFCDSCNRVRLTADGFLKACLQYQIGEDMKKSLRDGSGDEALREIMERVIWNKPISHSFLEENINEGEARAMSQIGG